MPKLKDPKKLIIAIILLLIAIILGYFAITTA